MPTLTAHLVKIYYVVLNHAQYGIKPEQDALLHEFLASTAEKFAFTGKKGDFVLHRVTQGEKYGFRLYSPSRDFGSAESVEVLNAANAEFAKLDTEYPEDTWHVKPFWA